MQKTWPWKELVCFSYIAMNSLEVRSRFTEYRVWLCAVLKVKFKEFTVFILKKKMNSVALPIA